MNFKNNYNYLTNLPQINFFIFLVVFFLSMIIILIFSYEIKVSRKISCYGIYNEGILQIKINNELSDKIKNNNILSFNKITNNYKISSFDTYEIIGNDVYQIINLSIDNYQKYYNNELGLVEIYYDNDRLIKHILKLFK